MSYGLRIGTGFGLMTLAALATFSSTLLGEEPKTEDATLHQYWADAKLFSLQPDEELATYRGLGGGGVGPNGTLGMVVGNMQHRFEVSIIGKLKARRFLANVTVKPIQEDTHTRAQEIEYDLSDLNPRSLEIARDENGRVYRLILVPSLIEKPQPKQFNSRNLYLENWSFPSSPVIVNDQDYIGRLGMFSGSLAWCDIPGLAKIEFSLLHLKGASASGTLEDGEINIAHENGTTLRISDVKNGVNAKVLAGGPYRVWVRWNKPTQSIEEYHKSLKAQIARLKEQIKTGDLSLPPGRLEQLEKMSESNRIGLTANGVRQVNPDDQVDPDE